MKFSFHQEIGARFKLVARKADGRIARETDWFCNLVLDTGLAQMSVGTWISQCCVGTGNSTPVATQTALDAFLASTTTQQATSSAVQVTTAPYYYSATVTWRFGLGVAAGNISEVGLGWGNTTLWNRALIKDANGNPTTITVLSDEYLDVVSEVRVYPAQILSGSFNLVDKTGALINSYSYTGLPYLGTPSVTFGQVYAPYLYVYSGASGSSVTALPSTNLGTTSSRTTTYPTPTSCKSVFNLDLNTVNGSHLSLKVGYAGLLSVAGWLSTIIGYKLQLNTAITKTSSNTMTYTFELSWGRYTG
ncbi:hypothetical protein [Acinetobacter sp. MB5]|uniref:hypothetical protein n=1 Tax=Acinetobacter sp. MB5 TaxID=2069438 RepID=UPI000DCF96AD|nr:hypothetical protein [Acinetobacter sp. MB5]